MRKRVGWLGLVMVFGGCALESSEVPVNVLEIESSAHASCDVAFDVTLDEERRQRILTHAPAKPELPPTCGGRDVGTFLRVRNAVGKIAYYSDSSTYYFVDECIGEPTGLLSIETESGYTLENNVRINEFGREFAGEDLYILRCQPPGSTGLIELWPPEQWSSSARGAVWQ